MKLRVILISILLALLAIAGYKAQPQHPVPVHTPSSVKLVDPQPVGPPTTVHSPKATLDFSKVSVTTEAKPVEPVEVAPVEYLPVAQALPLAQSLPPVKASIPVIPVVPSAKPVTACMEDEPCWDCSTMGNLICGPITQQVTAPAQKPVAPVTAPVKVTAPSIDPYSGVLDIPCKTGYVKAEDKSCVPVSYYEEPVTVKPAPEQPAHDCHKKLTKKSHGKDLHPGKGHDKLDSISKEHRT